MDHFSRSDARNDTSKEVLETQKLYSNSVALREYWDELFTKQYIEILESQNEIGRHGIIAEIINRYIPNGSILDAGCGTGILSQLLDHKKYQYIGCDISDVAISYSKKYRKNHNVHFINNRIENLKDLKDLSGVVYNESLYYLDSGKAIEQSRDLLKKTGLFIASIFDFPEGVILLDWLRDQLVIKCETVVVNQEANFQWNIIAGYLKA